MYTMKYCSAIKNETWPVAATWMEVQIVMLSKVSQTEMEKYCMAFLTCKIKKEMIQMNLFTKQKLIHKLRGQIYCCLGGNNVGQESFREFGINR